MTLSFIIHRSVANALPIDLVAPQSRAAGLMFGRLEYSTINARGQVRITCGEAMGIFLVEQLRVLAGDAEERHEGQLLVDTALAVAPCSRRSTSQSGEERRQERSRRRKNDIVGGGVIYLFFSSARLRLAADSRTAVELSTSNAESGDTSMMKESDLNDVDFYEELELIGLGP